jgi:hypothetical protein
VLASREAARQSDGATLFDIPAERTATMNEDRDRFHRLDPQEQQFRLQQSSLIHGGLIIIGVYMVAPFLTAASLDLSAKISVVAFSVAIPLLASLVILNRQEVFRRRLTETVLVQTVRVVAPPCAVVGVLAGFWHILSIAGVGMLAAALVAAAVLSVGSSRLERDHKSRPQEGEEPGDTAS